MTTKTKKKGLRRQWQGEKMLEIVSTNDAIWALAKILGTVFLVSVTLAWFKAGGPKKPF